VLAADIWVHGITGKIAVSAGNGSVEVRDHADRVIRIDWVIRIGRPFTYTPCWPSAPLPIKATFSPLMQGSGGQVRKLKLPVPPGIGVLVSAINRTGSPGNLT